MALTDKLTAIGNAIRGKTGRTEKLTLDEMVTAIEGIKSGGGGDEFSKFEIVKIMNIKEELLNDTLVIE